MAKMKAPTSKKFREATVSPEREELTALYDKIEAGVKLTAAEKDRALVLLMILSLGVVTGVSEADRAAARPRHPGGAPTP